MVRARRIALVFILLLLGLSIGSSVMAQSEHVDVLTIKGAITPVLTGYVERGIRHAEDTGAEALVIKLDTPGGLDTAMRDIIQAIIDSRVPVVVYVAPSGARAASAGCYILLSAHVAAMAQNTVTGAATPISIGDSGSEADVSDELQAKILNDAAAYIRTLATTNGRNADWAEKAVREGVSITEQEALDMNVIEVVAPDLPALLTAIDGRQATLINGDVVTLHTAGAAATDRPMSLMESFLYAIADPNIAYLLLSVATLGIMAELFNPGLIFPGIIGGICLLLAFYALGTLPFNWAGILLIVLAIGLFVGEALTTTFGIFTAGGIVSLVIGSMILFQGASPVFRIAPGLIAGVTIAVSGTLIFMVQRAVVTHRKQAFTGREELVGKTATVRVALNPDGTVFFKGERWSAVSDSGEIPSGEEVVIESMDGLVLHVSRKVS
jgi:membrane-bound serine protease (ClpP class)